MYALSLAKDGRILHATLSKYAPSGATLVASLPDGDIADYLYVDGEYIYDPLPVPENVPSAQEDIDAMLIEHEYRLTLLELGLTE